MSDPTFHAALRQYLLTLSNEFNKDLVDRVLKESPDIELQCNIREDIGKAKTRKGRDGRTFKYRVDGHVEFWSTRCPKNAGTEPDWDHEPNCPFPMTYFQEIGTTGFALSGNQLYAYDLDSVWGHGEQGLSDERLEQIRAVLEQIDYVELRRSTSGKGFHIWIRATGVEEANHAEHTAVARALLGQLCLDAGLDFASDVDVIGGNTWFASRRATVENRGFELLVPAKRILTLDDIPSNWRDHLDVVRKKRSRVRVPGNNEDQCADWSTEVAMDDEHRRIIREYEKTGYVIYYNPDIGCWHAHTGGFAAVHKTLGLRGFFATDTTDKEPGDPNCYVFLRPNGVFFLVRFNSRKEHPSWSHTDTEKQNACCYYNTSIDLRTACEVVGGIWMGKACTCHTLEQAKRLAAMFGFTLPPLENDRPVNFKYVDSHTIAAETAQVKGETVTEWGLGYCKLVVTFEAERPQVYDDYSSVARHLVADKENAGWCMKTDFGEWHFEPKDTVLDRVCDKFGIAPCERAPVAGKLAANPYILVNEPYQPEFLPGKRMNRFGAQLAVSPTEGEHPHFDMILHHVGRGLDEAVEQDEWCQAHWITTGYDFVLLWCALLVQMPKQHLPMLYLYSRERDNGKSALYRALGRLFSRGFVEGVRALNEKFNKLLAGAVLVYLDEEKVSPESAQKVKLYIDSDKMTMRLMRTDSFMFDNFTHWIATYNFTDGVPVEDGDERVIMVEVPTLYNEEKLDWKTVMLPALEKEKSNFLGTLMDLELPPSGGRLYLPILSTPFKDKVMKSNRTQQPCDREELLERIVEKVTDAPFHGQSKDLVELLGSGSWDGSRNHLRRYIREIELELKKRGIHTDLSHSRFISLELAV